jgi:hypothetical protein
MLRIHVLAVAAAAFVFTSFLPDTADAARRHRVVKHRAAHVATRTATVGPYYGMPGSYYPAPPFPFFLIPGPWWLPAGQ